MKGVAYLVAVVLVGGGLAAAIALIALFALFPWILYWIFVALAAAAGAFTLLSIIIRVANRLYTAWYWRSK